MKNLKFAILVVLTLIFSVLKSNSQIVSGNLFLQGKYLEIGAQANASLGSGVAAPAGYHPRTGGPVFLCGGSSSSLLASVYDFGLDGWTIGTPNYMGDYTLPGSPWEGWGIEISGIREWAYSSNCNLSGGLVPATGNWISYLNSSGKITGDWSGSFLGGQLQIRKEYRVDTLSSALVISVRLYNTGTTTLNNVYYMRSCDPDQSVPWGGSFSTINTVRFQNDFYHRVMVSSTATGGTSSTGSPAASISLGTKDDRAKCMVYNSWPLATTVTYVSMWSGTATGIGTSYYGVNTGATSDIAIGLVYNLCNILPGDSTTFSYAYIYNGSTSMQGALDTAFPEPTMIVNGSEVDSVDTITTCISSSGLVNLEIKNASDKNWSWSKWTWSPGIGLSSTTGVSTILTLSSISAITTYTITGVDTTRCRKLNKKFLLTVIPILAANPVVSDTMYCQNEIAAPLSSGVAGIGILKWYTSLTGGVGSTISPIPNTTTPGLYTWWVTQTIAGCESFRLPINVIVNPTYTINKPISICPGEEYIFDGIAYNTEGIYPVKFYTTNGCDSTIRIIVTILPTQSTTINDSICSGDTIHFAGISYNKEGVYSRKFINQYGCDSVSTLNLKVIKIPEVQIDEYPKSKICKGDTVSILATNQKNNVIEYYWNFDSTLLADIPEYAQGIYTFHYPDTGKYNIKLVVKNTYCYSDTFSKLIEVQDYPDARISEFNEEVCIGDKINFSPLNPKQNIVYRWLPIYYFYNQDLTSQTYIQGYIDASRTAILYAMSSHGCVSMDSVKIDPKSCCKFNVPLAFTPNGDGLNDLFRPIGDRFKIHQFSIFNRWGQEVYTSKLLASKGWDGTYKGIIQEVGVYYWVIIYECEGEQHIEKGDVTLIR
jgi:gliding motility-associated-like protein